MNRPYAFGLLLCLVLSMGVACGGRDKSPAPTATPTSGPAGQGVVSGCGKQAKAGSTVENLVVDGVQRSYRLYVPRDYQASKPAPLVLNFHGLGSNGLQQERYTEMPAKADEAGFITVAPDGNGTINQWNLTGSASGRRGAVDDFSFVRQLVDHLESELCIDPSRIYATGISNGAMLSSLLACELNDVFAAVGVVAGEPFSAQRCEGKSPIPIIIFHGTADSLVPFETRPGENILGVSNKGALDSLHDWAQFDGCSLDLRSQEVAADVTLNYYTGCRNGADAQLYAIKGGGHTWPGATLGIGLLGNTTQSINATDLIWAFFAAHAKT